MDKVILLNNNLSKPLTLPVVQIDDDVTAEAGNRYEVDSNQSVEVTLPAGSEGDVIDVKLTGIGEAVVNGDIITRQGQTLRATRKSTWVTRKTKATGSMLLPAAALALETNLAANNTTAMVVIKDGIPSFVYGAISHNADMRSLRKQITVLLIGHAVGEGQLDLYGTMEDYGITDGADGSVPPLSSAEQQATLEMLLKSRSGVYHPAAFETQAQIDNRPDREEHPPDTYYYYNNWDFNTAQAIYHENVGDYFQAIADVLGSALNFEDFDPGLCVDSYSASKSIYPAKRVWMSARDRAKVAQLILQRGYFNGVQLIPRTFMDAMWTPYSYISSIYSYGYSWVVARHESEPTDPSRPVGFGRHSGSAGQRLYCMPHQGLAAGIACDPAVHPEAGVDGTTIIETLLWAGQTNYGSLDPDFSQAGRLKVPKIIDPLQVEDKNGQNTLTFGYPMQEHERFEHTWRPYLGMTWEEVDPE